MAYHRLAVKSGLERPRKKNLLNLIHCPHEVGISPRACLKRHQSAQQTLPDPRREDFMPQLLRKALLLCRDCPIGKRLAFWQPRVWLRNGSLVEN